MPHVLQKYQNRREVRIKIIQNETHYGQTRSIHIVRLAGRKYINQANIQRTGNIMLESKRSDVLSVQQSTSDKDSPEKGRSIESVATSRV